MCYKYFIAETKDAFLKHIQANNLSRVKSRFICDQKQLSGISDITINVIKPGRRILEEQIVANRGHHNVKLEYINGNA